MEKSDDERDQSSTEEQASPPSPGNLGRQLVGALIGAAIALMLGAAALQLGWIQGNLTRLALWGGVIGGLIGGSEALAAAGKRLTKRDNPVLNVVVALVGMAAIFSVLFALVYWLSILIRQILGH
jgi:hypothetical protein